MLTHWPLKLAWLKESDFYVEFIPPYVYSKFISNQEISQKIELYAKYADRDEMSKTWAQKHILGMTDAEINEMNQLRLFDGIMAAMVEGIGEKYMGGEIDASQITKLKTMSMSSLEEILAHNIFNVNKINVTTADEENGEGGEGEGSEGGDEGGGEDDMGGIGDDMGGEGGEEDE